MKQLFLSIVSILIMVVVSTSILSCEETKTSSSDNEAPILFESIANKITGEVSKSITLFTFTKKESKDPRTEGTWEVIAEQQVPQSEINTHDTVLNRITNKTETI